MTALQIAALRLTSLIAVALVLAFSVDWNAKESAVRPAAQGSARRLVEDNDCGGDIPDPTHSVITVNGVTRYAGQKLTDKAIEQAVFGIDHGLTVHSFCS